MSGGMDLNDDSVDVIVPLDPRHASTLRTMALSLGAENGFSVDEIDDIKLALTEAFSMLVVRHPGKRARANFVGTPTAVAVRLSLESGIAIEVEPDELALAILRGVVDSYEIGDLAITLQKRAVETSLQGR